MKKLTDKQRHSILERASHNFFLLPPPSIGRKDMIKTLPPAVREQILCRLAERGLPETGVDFRVKLFGSEHKTFKRDVLAPRAAIRTYTDRVGTPTARKCEGRKTSSHRLLPVGMFQLYSQRVSQLQKVAEEAFSTFLPDYEAHLHVGRQMVDHNFPFQVEWHGQMVPVSHVLAELAPTRKQFEEAFYIDLPAPKRLTVTDFSDLNLPADLVDQWHEQELLNVEEQIDNAKERLIEDALKLVRRVSKQLGNEKGKLYDTLISDAADLGDSLKGLVEGYDPADLQLRNAAVSIKEKIGQVRSTEVWKTSVIARAESLRAAKAAEKVLQTSRKMLQDKRAASAPVDTSISIEGAEDFGMLADIL